MPRVVKTSATPNPLAIKFHMDCKVISAGSLYFSNPESAVDNPVASDLFQVPSVLSVFYINEVVSITKSQEGDWDDIIPQVADILEEKLVSTLDGPGAIGERNVEVSHPSGEFSTLSIEDKINCVERILDISVRPGLAGDGGGIEVLGIKDDTVRLHYEGACGSCPSSTDGTLGFIEKTLKEKLHSELKVEVV